MLYLAHFAHVILQQVHTDPSVLKCNLLTPSAVGELLETELVAVVMGLSNDEGVVLEVRVELEEPAYPSIEMMKISIGLSLLDM